MWHKVKWLTFWVSMVLWFGNFWGCAAPGEEQNYKSTAPERPSRFERYDSHSVPVDGQADGTIYVAQDTTPATPAAPAAETKPADPNAPVPPVPPVAPTDPPIVSGTDHPAVDAPETEPSLRGIDRSHWPKIKPAVETGKTYHGPVYYTDYPADRPEPLVAFNDPVEAQLQAALSGTKDHGLIDGHHALQLLSQPSKFGLDTILAPIRMFQTPPWKLVTTPP